MTKYKYTKDEVFDLLNQWNTQNSIFVESIEGGLQESYKVYSNIWNSLQDKQIADLNTPPGYSEVIISLLIAGVGGQLVSSVALAGVNRILRSRLSYVNYAIKVKIPKNKRDATRRKLRIEGATLTKKHAKINVSQVHDDGSFAHILYSITPSIVDMLGSRVDEFLQENFDSKPEKKVGFPSQVTDFSVEIQTWYRAKRVTNEHIFNKLKKDHNDGLHKEIAENFDDVFQEVKKSLVNEETIKTEIRDGIFAYKQIFIAASWALHMAPPLKNFGPVSNYYDQYGVGEKRKGANFNYVYPRKKNGSEWTSNTKFIADNLAHILINPDDPEGRTFYDFSKFQLDRYYNHAARGVTNKEVIRRAEKAKKAKLGTHSKADLVLYLDKVYRHVNSGEAIKLLNKVKK